MSASTADRVRLVARTLGEILITVGLVLLLLVVYQLWWTNVEADRAADQVRDEIVATWARDAEPQPQPSGSGAPTPTPTPTGPIRVPKPEAGEGFGLVYIPRLSDSVWGTPLIEGVTLPDLARGIGHYPDSAIPGQKGNFAIAGHRATNGEPLKDIDRLRVGDTVIIETQDAWYTYVLEKDQVVDPTALWVVDPVPGDPGAKPTERLITVTTCNPRWASYERWIWWGTRESVLPKWKGTPPAIEAGPDAALDARAADPAVAGATASAGVG